MKAFSISILCVMSIVLPSKVVFAEQTCEEKKLLLEERIFTVNKAIVEAKKDLRTNPNEYIADYPYTKPQVDGGLVLAPWSTCEEKLPTLKSHLASLNKNLVDLREQKTNPPKKLSAKELQNLKKQAKIEEEKAKQELERIHKKMGKGEKLTEEESNFLWGHPFI